MRASALALLCTVLGGCALAPVLEGGSVDQALAQALAASRGPMAEQKAALLRAQQDFARDPSAASRLRLAAVLSALKPPLRDDARAAELLEPISDASSAGVGRYAALLSAQIAERQRLVREIERLGREAERAEREQEKEAREQALVDKERDKREESLRRQLEALRSIERGILEREERLRRKTR